MDYLTEMFHLEDKKSPASGSNIKDYLNKFAVENAALDRLPTGDKVARLCYFLASDVPSTVTRQCINVDCGVIPQ